MTTKEKALGLPICFVLALAWAWVYELIGLEHSPGFMTLYVFWCVVILSSKVHHLMKVKEILTRMQDNLEDVNA